MRIIIRNDPSDVGDYVANLIVKTINDFKPTQSRRFVLGLPTGSSPLPTYKKLIQLCKDGAVSFKYVTTFNMDEYVGIPRDHPESYHTFMWKNLFSHIDIDPKYVNILDGNAKDIYAECIGYENKIKDAGGVHLFVGGM